MLRKTARVKSFCTMLVFTGMSLTALAQWSVNPAVNNPICAAPGSQYDPRMCSDGSGGAIIAWTDARPTANGRDIYAQRILSTGSVQWAKDGIPICAAPGDQGSFNIPAIQNLYICSDGGGGALIVWTDARNLSSTGVDIYAQRVNAAGIPQWTANGIPVCTASWDQLWLRICSDGAGGAIAVWKDERGSDCDIYAQRIGANGTVLWTTNGLPICTASWDQERPVLCSDGNGGAVFAWEDSRTGTEKDIYAQRISAAGNAQWTANGIVVCSASGDQDWPDICPDCSGGAFITWEDQRTGTDHDIYAQRVSSSGIAQWTANGVPICTSQSSPNQHPLLCSDGGGGAIIAWRGAWGANIFAQGIGPTGNVRSTVNGIVAIARLVHWDWYPLVSDGSGGAFFAVHDFYDIFAQALSSSGAPRWNTAGMTVSCASGHQWYPDLCSDGSGGAIGAWQDGRTGLDYDIYASKINSSGQLYPVEFLSFSACANGGTVTLSWEITAEVNNRGFVVERMAAGNWETIGFVPAKAKTATSGSYRFEDRFDPYLLHAERILYRLRQTDMDGKVEYSPVVEINTGAQPDAPALLALYPNPAMGRFTIPVSIPRDMPVRITLHTITGKEAMTMREEEILSAGYHVFTIHTEDIPSGMYLVEVTAGQWRAVRGLAVWR